MKFKQRMIWASVAAALISASAIANETTYQFATKQVSMFGPELKENEITTSVAADVMMFTFTGEVGDHLKKVIQIYCKVWDLPPGEYTLNLAAKTNIDELKIPICLNGTQPDDDKKMVKLGDYRAESIGKEWRQILLPVTIPDTTAKHGFIDMRVGEVPAGTELHLNTTVTFKAIPPSFN